MAVVPGYDDLLQEAQTTLDRVDAALARLADHSYGNCRQCGEPIGEERHTAAPTTDLCALHDAG